jgi:hypothetical protein
MGKVVEFAEDIEEYCQKFAEVFEDVYEEVSEFAKDKFDDASNLVDFLMEAMKAVGKHGELHGFDKKELVNDVVHKVIDDMTISFEEKDELRHKVAPHIGNIVEVMVAAAKGQLFLKKVGDKLEDYGDDVADSCQKCCAGCGSGCKPKPQPQSVAPRSNVAKDVPIESGAVDDLGVIIYEKLRKMISTKHVTLANIISVVGIIMQLVQQYPTLLGEQKKQIVKNVIYRVIAEFPMTETDRLALKGFLDGTLDKTIDYIIAVANGEIDIIGQVIDAVDKISESCARCCAPRAQA